MTASPSAPPSWWRNELRRCFRKNTVGCSADKPSLNLNRPFWLCQFVVEFGACRPLFAVSLGVRPSRKFLVSVAAAVHARGLLSRCGPLHRRALRCRSGLHRQRAQRRDCCQCRAWTTRSPRSPSPAHRHSRPPTTTRSPTRRRTTSSLPFRAPPEVASAPLPRAAGSTVTVGPGMTLYSVARANNLSVSQLAAANGIKPPYSVHTGQMLRIPG